ncbi:ketol-acid reductoisomerase [Pseudomonas lactis]|uniref:ketol-acid reductoisomerase n=1 Tax=Pseudomonas lactis TaxID=1615674 RepID=UPI00147569FD|nr:ketol-acid reductoisomerase [Pseudomonas lactis]NNA49652.1 N-formylglutamate amidohydrolase [Pseudomonas lactis]
MNLRPRAISVTLAIGLLTTMGVAQAERALIEPSQIQEAITIETAIEAQSATAAPTDTAWYAVLKGSTPVLITAPHATKPYREGSYRFSDGAGTAALAKLLNTLTCATVIYTQYRSPSDPNYYDDNAFKAEVAELIKQHKPKLLIDLHGSSTSRPYDVDFGTMEGTSLLGRTDIVPSLRKALRKEGLRNFSDDYFPAAKHHTLTRFASSLGVPSVQLEINSTWLLPSQGDIYAQRFSQLLQGLTRYIRNTNDTENGACRAGGV